MRLVEWQRPDPESGVIQPWYTHPALDEIQHWDLSGATVLEWGGGLSTLWWASRAKRVFTVESDAEWRATIASAGLANVTLIGCESVEQYARVPDGCAPTIAVVDGLHRTACLRVALELPRPLVLIVDNWQQDFVYLDEEAAELMHPHAGHHHYQPGHIDHQGRPWQTAIWRLT